MIDARIPLDSLPDERLKAALWLLGFLRHYLPLGVHFAGMDPDDARAVQAAHDLEAAGIRGVIESIPPGGPPLVAVRWSPAQTARRMESSKGRVLNNTQIYTGLSWK